MKWATRHTTVARYLRSFASWLGGNSNDAQGDFVYNTRVESVTKRFNEQGEHRGWTLLLRKFVRIGPDVYDESWWEEASTTLSSREYLAEKIENSISMLSLLPREGSPCPTSLLSPASSNGKNGSQTASSTAGSIAAEMDSRVATFWLLEPA